MTETTDSKTDLIRTASETARYLEWKEGCLTRYSSVPEFILISKSVPWHNFRIFCKLVTHYPELEYTDHKRFTLQLRVGFGQVISFFHIRHADNALTPIGTRWALFRLRPQHGA